MNDSKNMILAVVLSALVLIGWTMLSDRFFPQPKPVASQPGAASRPGTPASTAPAVPDDARPSAPAAMPPMTAAQALQSGPRVRISTPSLEGSISLKGARFDDLRLVRHADHVLVRGLRRYARLRLFRQLRLARPERATTRCQ